MNQAQQSSVPGTASARKKPGQGLRHRTYLSATSHPHRPGDFCLSPTFSAQGPLFPTHNSFAGSARRCGEGYGCSATSSLGPGQYPIQLPRHDLNWIPDCVAGTLNAGEEVEYHFLHAIPTIARQFVFLIHDTPRTVRLDQEVLNCFPLPTSHPHPNTDEATTRHHHHWAPAARHRPLLCPSNTPYCIRTDPVGLLRYGHHTDRPPNIPYIHTHFRLPSRRDRSVWRSGVSESSHYGCPFRRADGDPVM